MPTKEQQRAKLIGLLKELFQLNQPDLDFGFYRIMHAKAKEVTEFLENDLLKITEEAFGQVNEVRIGELRKAYEDAIADAKRYGAANPEETEPVKQAKATLDTAADTSRAEGEVYDHLYRFFERYYDGGDFLSRRYLTRETEGKAAPYAIPYNGEEVKLHWANADQYYIKTTEYFNNYRFDLAKAPEIVAKKGELFETGDLPPLLVEFRIVQGTEGEHGNIKAGNGQTRYFILHADDPVSLENGHLIVRFEYRPDPEKSGTDAKWQEKKNDEATALVLEVLESLDGAGEYARLFRTSAPTDKQKERPLIARYLARYAARNTMDYFIHKDLGSFLCRELDFYIKNEVMRLDDIESAAAPKVEQYLDKLRVLRKIAHKLIDFLAQLEDFQKRLWLKKKFVLETNYCITLDRVLAIEDEDTRDWLLGQIVANNAQREEWVSLLAIDKIEGDLTTPGFSMPLKVEFLKAYPTLVVDTAHFHCNFTERFLGTITELDEVVDGLLVHGENFQALGLFEGRHQRTLKSIYIDPPYNTDAGPINYKNGYRSASWVTMMANRLSCAKSLLAPDGIICVTIDDYQVHELSLLLDDEFGRENQLGIAVIRNNPSGRSTVKGFSVCHEYAFFYRRGQCANLARLPRTEKQLERFTKEDGVYVDWRNFRKDGGAVTHRTERPKQFYPIYAKPAEGTLRIPKLSWDKEHRQWDVLEQPEEGEVVVWPIDEKQKERVWSLNHLSAVDNMSDLEVRVSREGKVQVFRRHIPSDGVLPRTWWDKKTYAAREHGSAALTDLFGVSSVFTFAKSPFAVQDCIWISGLDGDSRDCVLDFFAGSGTTGHAVVNLNRGDSGRRTFIQVEMGEYFDTVLVPRTKKVTFAPKWKDGKPACKATDKETERSPRIVKLLQLESYEDCLNNLDFVEDKTRDKLIAQNPQLREDYMLRYMLDVETKGSQSLLNIDGFKDPTAYELKVKKPGSDEYEWRNVDLLETFNYLIGLRVEHIAAPQVFTAEFKREPDPDLPEDQNTKLVLDGKLKQNADGPWWFRKVEGWVPTDINNPNNGHKEKVLIVWRKLTGDMEKDNLMLDEWFSANRISTRDFEFDTIYVNGSNNLPNLRQEGDTWKVRLIEEDFHKLMWDVEDV